MITLSKYGTKHRGGKPEIFTCQAPSAMIGLTIFMKASYLIKRHASGAVPPRTEADLP